MHHHACQRHSRINGSTPTPRGDSDGVRPWQAFCGGMIPRQSVREALVGEAPASEREVAGSTPAAHTRSGWEVKNYTASPVVETPRDEPQESGATTQVLANEVGMLLFFAPVARGPRYRECRSPLRERLLVLVARHVGSAAWSVCGSRWCNSTRATY